MEQDQSVYVVFKVLNLYKVGFRNVKLGSYDHLASTIDGYTNCHVYPNQRGVLPKALATPTRFLSVLCHVLRPNSAMSAKQKMPNTEIGRKTRNATKLPRGCGRGLKRHFKVTLCSTR